MSRARMAEGSDEARIQQFREALQTWKRTVLFQGLNNEADEGSIPRRVEEAHQMFFALMQAFTGEEVSDAEAIQTILAPLGER